MNGWGPLRDTLGARKSPSRVLNWDKLNHIKEWRGISSIIPCWESLVCLLGKLMNFLPRTRKSLHNEFELASKPPDWYLPWLLCVHKSPSQTRRKPCLQKTNLWWIPSTWQELFYMMSTFRINLLQKRIKIGKHKSILTLKICWRSMVTVHFSDLRIRSVFFYRTFYIKKSN